MAFVCRLVFVAFSLLLSAFCAQRFDFWFLVFGVVSVCFCWSSRMDVVLCVTFYFALCEVVQASPFGLMFHVHLPSPNPVPSPPSLYPTRFHIHPLPSLFHVHSTPQPSFTSAIPRSSPVPRPQPLHSPPFFETLSRTHPPKSHSGCNNEEVGEANLAKEM